MAMTKENAEELVFIMMLGVETYIKGEKKGAERKQQVMDWFYKLMPPAVTRLFPQEILSALIENLMERLKERLAENVNA